MTYRSSSFSIVLFRLEFSISTVSSFLLPRKIPVVRSPLKDLHRRTAFFNRVLNKFEDINPSNKFEDINPSNEFEDINPSNKFEDINPSNKV